MRRVIGLVVLTVGLGVLGATSFSPAEAQDKDAKTKKMKDKDKDPKGKKEAPGAGGTVEIYKAKDGYRFRVKDADGKTIAMPARGHDSKDEVMKDLDAVKAILTRSKPIEVKD